MHRLAPSLTVSSSRFASSADDTCSGGLLLLENQKPSGARVLLNVIQIKLGVD
jgi:hypothetical protein